MNPNPKIPINPLKYSCEKCHYNTSNKKDYRKHEQTIKHKTGANPNDPYLKNPPSGHQCKCGKKYKHASTLSAHKKNCNLDETSSAMPADIAFFTNLVLEVVKNNSELQKQNQDFQKQMLELYKTTPISHNHMTNSHNKTFNLQFFLNEQCKDAMNMVDFVNSMTLELSDLEEVGKLGYVEGISNIIIRKLNALDIYKRPIHCSDGKREIMYVKEDDVWEKENNAYDKLRKVIKQVTYKNSAMLVPWSEKYPNCMNNQHHLNDVYVRMMGQAMGGRESFMESENKIMKKIAKAVLIEK
jgi:hypothetical protein